MPDVELSSLGSVIKTAYETQADTNAFTDAEQTKLAGITAGAEANVDTNLGVTADGVQLLVTSSTGTSTSLPAATGTTWGVMSDEIFDAVVLNTAKVTNVTTNLAYTTAASDGTVTSSDGTDATIPAATVSLAGLLTGADKTKLDSIATGAQVNVATNLGYVTAASEGTVTSSDGTSATLPAATVSLAGLLTGADKTKLDGISPGAGAPVNTNLGYTTAASEGTVTSSDGTDATIPAATQALAGLLTATDKTKLDIAVILTGTPVNNQIGVWTNANTQEGDANLTWDGTTLTVTGDITSTGRVIGTNARTKDLVFLTVNGGTGVANPADPEGSNDPFDTVANAFKYAEETYSGINHLELNILAGTYNTGATLVIPSNVGQIAFYGAGIGTTILNFTQLSGSNVHFVYFFNMTVNTTTTFVSFIGNLQLKTVTWNTAGPIIFGGITDNFWELPGSAIENSTIVATSASATAFDLISCIGHLKLTGTVAISLTNSNTTNGTNGGSILTVDTGSLEIAASATINIQDEAANVATEGDITIANGAKYIAGTGLTITNGNFITDDTTGVIVGQLRPAITSLATSRALAITDATDIIEVDASAGAVEVTIPLNATVPFPIGTAIVFTLVDVTNATTIVGDTGVTVNGVVTGSGDFTGAQWDVIEIYKRGTDEWVVTPISNQTATEIKTAYESNADTNAFTDAEQTKLGTAVILTGTPVDNQIGVWTNANTQEGDANLTWDGTTLAVTGAITSTGRVIGSNTLSKDYVYIFVNGATGVANPVDPEGTSAPFDTIANALTYAETTYSGINRLELEIEAGTYAVGAELRPPTNTTNFVLYGAGIGTTILNFDGCRTSDTQFLLFYNMTVNTGLTDLALAGNTIAGTLYLLDVAWNTSGRFFFGGSPWINWGVQGSVIQNSTITATWDTALSRPLISCTGNLQFIGTVTINITNSTTNNGTNSNDIINIGSGILAAIDSATLNIQDELASTPVAGTIDLEYGSSYTEGTGVTITNGTFVRTDASGVVQGDIKTVYEANADTNAFTDAEQTKLGSAVILTGTPVDNQLGVWTNANTQEGDANLTWDATTLSVTGEVDITGNAVYSTELIAVATSRTLALTDRSCILEVNTSGGAVDLLIPANAAVAFPIGTVIDVSLIDSTSAATITGNTGVTLNGVSTGAGTITAANYSGCTLYKRATDEWVVQGQIGAIA